MAIPPFRDLVPKEDVKGGSPRTPSGGIPVREVAAYQDQYGPPMLMNGNGNGVWRAIATGLGGLVVGLLVAWFTAFVGKGISHKEMEEYVAKYTPYAMDKDSLADHNRSQDVQLGELRGKQEKNASDILDLRSKVRDDEHDLSGLSDKVKLFGDYVEEQRHPKK